MPSFLPKTFLFLLPIFASLFIFSGCAKTQEQKELKLTDNNVSIRIEGAVYPLEKQNIISAVAGYVKNVYVKNGDRVKKGDIIYSLDKELINLDIENKKIEISTLEKIKVHTLKKNTVDGSLPAINLAAIELKRVAFLRSKGYLNKFEENTYKKNYINALFSNNQNNNTDNFEKIKNLSKQIMSSKIDLKKLEYRLKHADAYARIDGFIAGLRLSKGESIGTNRKICSVVNLDKVLIKAGFSTGLLPFIYKNQKINISFVTTPPYSTSAVIQQVNPIVNPAFDRMTVNAIIPNPNYILQEGTRALVTISLSKKGQDKVKKYFLNNNKNTTLEIKSKI